MAMTDSRDLAQDIRRSLHELAQPLSALTGLIDLLLMEMDKSDPKLREMQLISEQLEKVRQILAEIRHMARGASGGEPPKRETMSLQKL